MSARFQSTWLVSLALGLLVPSGSPGAAATSRMIANFSYPTQKEAAAAWLAKDKTPPVALNTRDSSGLIFPCPFDRGLERVYWDHPVRLDLSGSDSLELDLSCARPEALRALFIYFKSGNGWYVASKPLNESGRQRLIFAKSDFSKEGNPAGWNRIEAIRISPWKGASLRTELAVFSISTRSGSILLIQGTLSAPNEAERSMSRRTTQRISRWLTDLNLSHVVVNDEEVTPGRLARAGVAILCYNPEPPPAEIRALRSFIQQGGKLLVFYSSSPELAGLMSLKLGDYKRTEQAGTWSGFAFDHPARDRVPPRVYQDSMNIRPALPLNDSSEIIAHWENAEGKGTGDPAWVVSPQGAWMSHILLEGDGRGKQRMLLGLIGRFDPAVWRPAARRALERAGKIGPYGSLPETLRRIRDAAAGTPDEENIVARLTRAATDHDQMVASFKREAYTQVLDQEDDLYRMLTEAYAGVQQSQRGEFRGVWDHDGVGWYPGQWDRTCQILARHGFTAVFPNMLWGGLAHFPGTVLPPSTTYKRFGDQVEQCVRAAHRNGMQVHVWKVCWNLGGAPADFVSRMKSQHRLQVSLKGETMPWLCPSNPDNVAQEINSLAELVRKYDVDGIHLDYIRFPGVDACYCPVTRTAFEKWSGRAVARWPQDVQPGGKLAAAYQRFRIDQINLVVRAVHHQVRPLKPDLKISAAVFSNYPECLASVGQDWPAWLKNGWVDFVVPMNYTTSSAGFAALVREQLNLPSTRNRVYPGLGVTANESELRADQVIDQIVTLRKLGAPGFVVFDLSHTLRDEVLPVLSLGITKP